MQTGNWLLASAHSKSKVQRPKRLIRPGERDPQKIGTLRSYSIEEMDRILRESNGPNSPYKAVSTTVI